MIRIIGIGSPFGDDAVGLEIARTIAAAPPPNCEVIEANRPGAGLLDLLQGADAAILVDAVCSGAAPGTMHEFGLDELDGSSARFASSHDLGVATAIQLAQKLGLAPSMGRLIGIEIARTDSMAQCDGLSSKTREAMRHAVERVRSLAVELNDRRRERLILSGTVQGVGLRPFVWRLAKSLQLRGFVRNVASGVEIEIEGNGVTLCEFRRRLETENPSAAAIENIRTERLPLRDDGDFHALPSERGRAAITIPPDLATCPECVREILDPEDRRYRYPFTSCTSCGPRFTVVRTLPYDRENTTMRDFPLCEQCRREYLDPSNRRFRAEPIACPECGPQTWLEVTAPDRNEQAVGEDCIARGASILRAGGIVAVQGIGGVHLACDATSDAAVARLRAIKRRPHKPLAVMVDSIEAARNLAEVSDAEAALLTSPQAPIILLRKRSDTQLAQAIAPGNDRIGIMIAYSPLHHLLIGDAARPLVMTSANQPGEPLARDASEARAFADQVDALLLHNRPIHQRCDDAVWIVESRGAQPIRLSRGGTPRSLSVPVVAPVPILAVGGDIKNSFCILSDGNALMSQYIGSLESIATQDHFSDSLEKWIAMSGITPRVAAHDLHPQSFARAIAERLGMRTIGVQHHHAHIAACMAENGHQHPVIGIAFDGTGYGLDGAIWGGEAMLAGYADFERLSHFQYLPLAGGDAAIRHPSRIAAGFLSALFGSAYRDRISALVGEEHAGILATMIDRGINTVPTSSCGRLFDAVAALLGVRGDITYEAQAAIELETLAGSSPPATRIYPFAIRDDVVQTGDILAAIVGDLEAGTPIASIARAFHETTAEVAMRMALDAREKTGIEVVALSGGCFQNRLLQAAAIKRLECEGFTVLTHRKVPANDGGLALGQAVVAAARLSSE